MTAAILAGLSGSTTVAAVWEGLGFLQTTAGRRSLGALAGPVRAAVSGREASRMERRRLEFVAGLTVLGAGYLMSGPLCALVLATVAPLVLGQVLRFSRERWRADLARGAPAVARAIADALTGGHSVASAVEEAGQSGSVPGAAGRELQGVTRELALGADQDVVLGRLAKRAADPSWDAIVAAIALQRRAGGDLAGLLRRIADVADERDRVDADARTLTAQARFTARLVASMPVAGLILAEFVAPGGIAKLLTNPLSAVLLVIAGLILASALVAIGRIARPLT